LGVCKTSSLKWGKRQINRRELAKRAVRLAAAVGLPNDAVLSGPSPWKLVVQDKDVRLHNLDEDIAEEQNPAKSKPRLVKQLLTELSPCERDVPGHAE
jgi:hypothetical protein